MDIDPEKEEEEEDGKEEAEVGQKEGEAQLQHKEFHQVHLKVRIVSDDKKQPKLPRRVRLKLTSVFYFALGCFTYAGGHRG